MAGTEVRRRDRRLELLTDRQDRSDFRCRPEEQSQWLRHHAYRSRDAGTASVFVICGHESESVRS